MADKEKFTVVAIHYLWKDDANKEVFSGHISVNTPAMVEEALANPEHEAHAEWSRWDESIFFYADNQAELEALYNDNNGEDFILVKEGNN
jgi:hypothetical protein